MKPGGLEAEEKAATVLAISMEHWPLCAEQRNSYKDNKRNVRMWQQKDSCAPYSMLTSLQILQAETRKEREGKIVAIQRTGFYFERQTKWESGPWVLRSVGRWEWDEAEHGKKKGMDSRVGTSHLGWVRKLIQWAHKSVWGSPFLKNSRLVCQQGVQMRTIRAALWGAGASSTSAA